MKKIFITLFISVFAFTAIAQKGVYAKKGYRWDNAGRSTINAGYTPELCDIDSILNTGVMGNLYDSTNGDYYISEIYAQLQSILTQYRYPIPVNVLSMKNNDTIPLTTAQIIIGGFKVDTLGNYSILSIPDIGEMDLIDKYYLITSAQRIAIPPGIVPLCFSASAAMQNRNIYGIGAAVSFWYVFYVTLR